MEGFKFFKKSDKKEGVLGVSNKLLMNAIVAAILSFTPAKAQELGLSERQKDSVKIANEVGKFLNDRDFLIHNLPVYYSTINGAEDFEKGSIDEKTDLILKKDSAYIPHKIGVRGKFEYARIGFGEKERPLNLEKLDEYFEQIYPKGFAYRNVDSVIATDSTHYDTGVKQHSNATYLREQRAVGTFRGFIDGEHSYEKAAEEFWRIMDHELAHSEDWTLKNGTSFKYRVQMLKRILDRVKSDDRYKSEYVESIKDTNKEAELYRKCMEYWAEIFQAYISGNDTLQISDKIKSSKLAEYFLNYNKSKQLSKEDYDIVHDYIMVTDPEFDLAKSRAIRAEAIKSIMAPIEEIKKSPQKNSKQK
jgi:hypothetical protein